MSLWDFLPAELQQYIYRLAHQQMLDLAAELTHCVPLADPLEPTGRPRFHKQTRCWRRGHQFLVFAIVDWGGYSNNCCYGAEFARHDGWRYKNNLVDFCWSPNPIRSSATIKEAWHHSWPKNLIHRTL